MSDGGRIYRGFGLSFIVPPGALNTWKGHRQIKENHLERFGVIIGSRSVEHEEYWVDMVTTPFPNDRATRRSFALRDNKHQLSVDQAFKHSGGTSIYLGTWHTHPEAIPEPSIIDMKDWLSCIKRNSGRQLFFVIVGNKDVRVFVRKGFCFRRLNTE